MTPEEIAAVIMANLATMPVGSERWDRCNEMVVFQIRQAIVAEREACAKVAEDGVNLNADDDWWSGYIAACEQIAAAIRSRSTEVKG